MLFSLSCNKQQDIIKYLAKDYTHKTNNYHHSYATTDHIILQIFRLDI